MSINLVLFWISLIALAAAASKWGGRSERAVAWMYLLAAVSTVFVRSAFSTRYQGVEIGIAAIDTLLLAGLVVVATRSDRWWPICATAFQALAVLSHVGKAINPGLGRLGYQMMAIWSAWPALIVLAVGIWRFSRRTDAKNTDI